MNGASEVYKPKTRELSFGVDAIRPIEIPAEDRNRTSPFPYGGARFEFRAVGSSQNVSLVNTARKPTCAHAADVARPPTRQRARDTTTRRCSQRSPQTASRRSATAWRRARRRWTWRASC